MAAWWSRCNHLSHCRGKKERDKRVETVAMFTVHSHRPGFGGQGGEDLLEVDGLQIITEGNYCSSFSLPTCNMNTGSSPLENLFSTSQNPRKPQGVPQGFYKEPTQGPGNGRVTVGVRNVYLYAIISLSRTIKLSAFLWSHCELKSIGRETVKIYPKLFSSWSRVFEWDEWNSLFHCLAYFWILKNVSMGPQKFATLL